MRGWDVEIPWEVIRPQLDPGIAPYVDVLRAAGVETIESCQGGEGHGYAEPTILFTADQDEAFRALKVALDADLPAYELRQCWLICCEEDLMANPWWEMLFRREGSS